MSASEFLEFIKNLLENDGGSFVRNMETLGRVKEYPHEWANMLIAWLELADKESAMEFYPEYYE